LARGSWVSNVIPMTLLRRSLAILLLVCVGLRAQTIPTVTQAIPAQSAVSGGAAITIDLRNHFGLPSVKGSLAQIDTLLGRINVELLADDAPRTVDNFLQYIDAGRYTNTIIHRSVPSFVIQGGGYFSRLPIEHIATFPAVVNEYKISNTRGTLAMAKLGGNPNSATSEWFINLADNSGNLNNQNGGFTVFARVIGTGMTVADAIAALPRSSDDFPLNNYTAGTTPTAANLLTVRDVKRIPIYPAVGVPGVIAFNVTSSNAAVATATLSGSTLTLTPGASSGTTTISVRGIDANANQAEATFALQIAAPATPPSIVVQPPVGVVAAVGQTVVFNVVASGPSLAYQWKRISDSGTAPVANATSATLVLSGVSAATGGIYFCTVTNPSGSVDSIGTILSVSPTATASRLTNLSVRSFVGLGSKTLIAGFVTSGTGAKATAIRGIGPTLGAFGVTSLLADPLLDLRSAAEGLPLVASNDNWSGDDGRAYGGFALPAGSKDAVVVPSLAPGGYTAQVTGAANGTGNGMVEVYDAAIANSNLRFINLSARTQVDAGQILFAGFSVGAGASKSLLIRAAGPALAAFQVPDTMADPKIEVFNSAGVKIMQNDNWGGLDTLTALGTSVGAFPLTAAARDAALVLTVPPGGYTIQVSGVDGSAGVVLVEVYELP
jgi:cyclophilin family peptidyl-prolyl cis-trans isomerase